MKYQTLKTKLLKLETPPRGWKTRQQWEGYWKVCKSAASNLLRQAVQQKECQIKKFKVRAGSPVTHYKFKE